MKVYNLIIFQIGPEYFVLEIDRMLQILRYTPPRSIPNAPPFIEGILIWENMVIPVVNLQTRLYPNLAGEPAKPKIFIIRLDALNVGFKIGNVHKLFTVEESQILPPPPALGGMVVDYIKGVIPHEGRVYLFLDLEKTLSSEEKKALKGVKIQDKGGLKK
jgi:purine-binding chemotaxis protein CheW